MNIDKLDQADLQLQAFVDEQLSEDEREAFLIRMDKNPELKRQVCDLRSLKIAVQHAYGDNEDYAKPSTSRLVSQTLFFRSVAALFILSIGLFLGWKVNVHEMPLLSDALVLNKVHADPSKVLLHIDQAEPEKLSALLDKAEALMKKYRDQKIHLEVIANSGGLDLMRKDKSPYIQRVKQLMDEYENIDFIACGNAIRRLQNEGEKVFLIDEVHEAPSAVQHIVTRLQQGWTYVKT